MRQAGGRMKRVFLGHYFTFLRKQTSSGKGLLWMEKVTMGLVALMLNSSTIVFKKYVY